MKYLTTTLAVIALVCSLAFTHSPVTQWEYKFEYNCTEKKANALGVDGWEIAAVQSTGPGLGNNVATYVFKRRK